MMNSNEYWRKREAEALRHYVHDEKEYQKRLAKIYQDMLDACQKEIESFYAKYAAAEGITLAEAKKRVSKADIAALERKAEKYVRTHDFSQRANAELRLYNATMKINRLEMLKANIGLDLIAGHDKMEKFMGGILQGRTEEELKRQAGILGETVRNNAQLANAIVNASFHNATFSDRIWAYQDMLRNELEKLLQSGLIQGKNPRQLARQLRRTFDTTRSHAERLMRTELARVQTEAQKQSFQRNGFSKYEFIANGSCCSVCAGLNGKHFEVEKMEPGLNAPPVHPNCRCSIAAWEDDAEYEAWLDYLDQGGSSAAWEQSGKAAWRKKSGKALEKSDAEGIIEIKEGKKLSLSNLEEFNEWQNDYYSLNSGVEFTQKANPNISAYSGGAYEAINGILRGGKAYERVKRCVGDLRPYEKMIDGVSREIRKFQLNTDLQVKRVVGSVDFITGATSSLGDMKSAIGKTFTEKGFTSTTIAQDATLPFALFKKTQTVLEIYVPKSTRGAYIYKISDHPAEFEFLIDKGTTYRVVDAGERTVKKFVGNDMTQEDVQERYMKLEVVSQ